MNVNPLTDVHADTFRGDIMQELSLPFYAGPFKLVPYAKLDLAEYTHDATGNEISRVWGGGGIRGSLPLSRIYPDVHSELFNLDGINHKITAGFNYFYADTNVPFTKLPQIDRLNTDADDQALRDVRFNYPFSYSPQQIAVLMMPQFDPQRYAIRNLVDNRIDTLDHIDILQLDLNQRLQTKRGYPGLEHIIDWMTLDLQMNIYPEAQRDNFGSTTGELQYDYIWNIGDRTALVSSGWMDTFGNGAKFLNIGAYYNRYDNTSFYLGYTYIEPLNTRAVTVSVNYVFSPKYSLSVSSTYDFGVTNGSLSNSVILTRYGSDLQTSVGFSYTVLTNSFSVVAEVVPNLVPANRRLGTQSLTGAGSYLH
jgi:hypothetical protein